MTKVMRERTPCRLHTGALMKALFDLPAICHIVGDVYLIVGPTILSNKQQLSRLHQSRFKLSVCSTVL